MLASEMIHVELEEEQRSLLAARDFYREIQLAIDVNGSTLDRGIGQSFANPARARRGIDRLLRFRGAEVAIKHVTELSLVSAAFEFGRMRGVTPAGRRRAKEALDRLPDVIREREHLIERRQDIITPIRVIEERIDRLRLGQTREMKPARTRPRKFGDGAA